MTEQTIQPQKYNFQWCVNGLQLVMNLREAQ